MTRFEEIKAERLELRKQLEAKDANLDDIKAKLDALEKEEAELRKKQEIVDKLNKDEHIDGEKVVETRKEAQKEVQNMENIYASAEYRKAFADYVISGKKIELRDATGTIMTTDAGAVLPVQVQNKIVEKLESHGGIYAAVSHTAYPTGVAIPTSSVKPVATWVAEGATSPSQKKQYGSITFAGNKIRVQVSASLNLTVGAIEAFENNLVSNVTDALVKAFDEAIVAGNGVGCPRGITKETPVETVALDKMNYQKLCEMEAAIPAAYDQGAVYVMSKKTLFALRSLKDASGVVAIETIDGKPSYSILGRRVILTDCLPSLAAAKAGDVVAFAMDLSDYTFNFNYNVSVQKREDWDTEDQQIKAVAIADGKTVDANGLVFYTAAAKA